MWIVFEGLDKSGKTTLEWELLKATNFKHIVIDRGPVGYLVFDKIFKREMSCSSEDFIKKARRMMKSHSDFLVIYCYADKSVVDYRLSAAQESHTYDYENAQKLYKSNVNRYYDKDRLLMLNTTNKSIQDCVEEIKSKIKEVKQNEHKKHK